MEKVKSQVEGNTLVVERSFNAPRELVFEAFSTPAHLEFWWGPAGWTNSVNSNNLAWSAASTIRPRNSCMSNIRSPRKRSAYNRR